MLPFARDTVLRASKSPLERRDGLPRTLRFSFHLFLGERSNKIVNNFGKYTKVYTIDKGEYRKNNGLDLLKINSHKHGSEMR